MNAWFHAFINCPFLRVLYAIGACGQMLLNGTCDSQSQIIIVSSLNRWTIICRLRIVTFHRSSYNNYFVFKNSNQNIIQKSIKSVVLMVWIRHLVSAKSCVLIAFTKMGIVFWHLPNLVYNQHSCAIASSYNIPLTGYPNPHSEG